jgi:pyridoxamine 5'-phosphate oxidase
MDIRDIRKDYKQRALEANDLNLSPIGQFEKWFGEALTSEVLEANAMTLATADKNGIPSARIVLLKEVKEDCFVFFSNYKSEKGQALAENPNGAMVFFWPELERQVRIEGTVKKIPAAESDEYFYSRPKGSQIGAIASHQSQPLDSRGTLEERIKTLSAEAEIKRPDHWGGYSLTPTKIEFWQGRPSRLHDRFLYTLHDDRWSIERLNP